VAGGAVSVTDVSDDEYGGEACRRVICREETRRVDIHACREAHWHAVDVAGARPVVVFSVFKRFLSANGFSVRLSWGRPDIRINVFRAPRPLFCELERPQMLEVADLRALGFERPDSEPSMGRWASSPCHAELVNGVESGERWTHGWDERDPAVLAELFVEWETAQDDESAVVPLDLALEAFGAQAIVMYLLGSRYGELLPPIHEGLEMARAHVDRVREALAGTIPGEPSPGRLACHREAFEAALSDDLDTPTAFLCLFDWIHEAGSMRSGAGDSDLRAMLWMIGIASPPAGAHRDMPSAPPARRRRS
jgi:hypothetical protein